jgi:hypothetical protein
MQYLRDLATIVLGLIGAGIVIAVLTAIAMFLVWIITLL